MHSIIRAIPSSRLLLLIVALVAAGPALSDTLEGEAVSDVPAPADSAEIVDQIVLPPGAEEDDTFDWIKFGSGEWLKGNMDRMRDGDLEFDSAELDGLKLDWGNVAEMRSPQPNTYLFEDQSVVTGSAVMKDGQLIIFVDGSPQVYDRTRLMAMIDGTQTEKNYWNGGTGVGFTGRTGNTESIDVSANAWIRREDQNTRLNISYLGAFGTVEGDENTNNHRVREQFDWFLTPRFYLIPIMFGFYNDKFQNISYRLSPATGLGYELYSRDSIDWNVTASTLR